MSSFEKNLSYLAIQKVYFLNPINYYIKLLTNNLFIVRNNE